MYYYSLFLVNRLKILMKSLKKLPCKRLSSMSNTKFRNRVIVLMANFNCLSWTVTLSSFVNICLLHWRIPPFRLVRQSLFLLGWLAIRASVYRSENAPVASPLIPVDGRLHGYPFLNLFASAIFSNYASCLTCITPNVLSVPLIFTTLTDTAHRMSCTMATPCTKDNSSLITETLHTLDINLRSDLT